MNENEATRSSKRTLAIVTNSATKRKEFVQEVHRDVQQRRIKRKEDLYRNELINAQDDLFERACTEWTPQRSFPQLPSSSMGPPLMAELCNQTSNTCDNDDNETTTTEAATSAASSAQAPSQENEAKMVTAKYRSPKNKVSSASMLAMPLEGSHEPLPKSSATIFLKEHYATEDEKNLYYVPYFGDDDREDVVSELYNFDERAKEIESGPKYRERDTDDAIDETLLEIQERLEGSVSETLQNDIHEDLALIMDVSIDRVKERFKITFCTASPSEGRSQAKKSSPATKPKKNSSTETPLSYKEIMDSYRNLFCRRCFSYDCNMHGNLSKPSLELQGKLAVQKEREGYWEKQKANHGHDYTVEMKEKEMESNKKRASSEKQNAISRKRRNPLKFNPTDSSLEEKELTALQKSICERMFLVFQGNIDKMATAMGASRDLVADFVAENKMSLKEFSHAGGEALVEKKKKSKSKETTSMKNYNAAWLRRVEDAEIHPLFTPCDHDGPCSEENCSCVQNAFFCTKHCVWGEKSRNFFRGCACKGGKCGTKSCACFAAKRECDPDLCRTCGACTDPPNQPATKQRCRNDNLSMRRHCHLLMAKSTIPDAGWGIFTKHALKKGDFVHEYVGEVISQEEAERRGRIYDKVNRSYLFNLSSDCVVDASRKGNKTRFANHSSKPNCYTKMVSVNGDIRIGLFAKDDIEPQSELFFDYRYDVSMDNALIVKPGKTVDWMKNPKMANKISKKHEGDS